MKNKKQTKIKAVVNLADKNKLVLKIREDKPINQINRGGLPSLREIKGPSKPLKILSAQFI
jgi:hypothetical protein